VDSPFEILGIEPDADDDEVERAYRDRVKEAHPDQGGTVREFKLVYRAYREIRDGTELDSKPTESNAPTPDSSDADPDTTTSEESEDDGESQEPDGSRVEYLNYEVIDDHGWNLDDEDLFEKAADADLDPADYGKFLVEPNESLLEAAEGRGFAWPFACRGGACANCAVAVIDGEMEMDSNHILDKEMMDRGIRLSCINAPLTDETKVVYNVKHMPDLDELMLPPYRFERAHMND
jgi:curved DNA-binding protein CbpA